MMYVFWLVAVWKFVCLHRSCPHYTAIWVLSLTLSHEAIRHLFTLYSAQDKTSTPHLVEQIIALTFSRPRAAAIIKSFPGDTKEKSCSFMWICILLSKTSWTTCSEEWDPQDSDVRLSSWALPLCHTSYTLTWAMGMTCFLSPDFACHWGTWLPLVPGDWCSQPLWAFYTTKNV